MVRKDRWAGALGLLVLAAGCLSSQLDRASVSTVPSSSASSGDVAMEADLSKVYEELNQQRIESLATAVMAPKTPGKVSSKFPNIDLIDQNGRTLKFYDDLVKDKVIIVNYFYTRCKGSCPGTTCCLKRLRDEFKREFGDKLHIISLTLNPEEDSPETLREYMQSHGIEDDPELCDWTFATGTWEDLDQLRRALGLYERDPVIDADRTQHASILTFGNDRTNRWAALPVGSTFDDVKQTIVRIAGDTQRQRYRDAVTLGRTQHGHLGETRKLSTLISD